MSKIGNIMISIKEGGLEGFLHLVQDYKYRHSNILVSEWPLSARINSDLMQFSRKFGYKLDIYNPQTFTEKIHTYKLLYNDPIMSQIVDKFDFKSYVKQILGSDKYTAPAYGVWDSFQEIKDAWDSLPSEFVFKSTISGDGKNIIFVKNKDDVDLESIKEDLEKCFMPQFTQLNGFARAYYTCKPRVLAEKYIHEFEGNYNLSDYKFYCFNGSIECVYTTSRVFTDTENPSDSDYPRTFFDKEWNKIDVTLENHPTDSNVKKPIHLEEMIQIAERLSKGFPFVRIDFYDILDTPLLGEMTFYPAGGLKPLQPLEYDRKLGEKFVLPKEKIEKVKI